MSMTVVRADKVTVARMMELLQEQVQLGRGDCYVSSTQRLFGDAHGGCLATGTIRHCNEHHEVMIEVR